LAILWVGPGGLAKTECVFSHPGLPIPAPGEHQQQVAAIPVGEDQFVVGEGTDLQADMGENDNF